MCRNVCLHPGGVPELCDPAGVDWRFWIVVRGCRLAPPPATFWQASGLRRRTDPANPAMTLQLTIEIQCRRIADPG